MKTPSIFFVVLLAGISARAQTQSVGNSKVNTDFSKYKTFTWAPADNEVIHNAIFNELEGRGYRESPDHPDLIVVYQVLEKKGKIHAYKNDYPFVTNGKEIRQPSDTTTFTIEPGTVIINLVDAKTDQAVWSGFSSGLLQGLPEEDALVTDELQLREAVHSIFEKFKYGL